MHTLFQRLNRTANQNSPAILTALAISGTITTAFLAARAAYASAEVLSEESPPPETTQDKAKLVWKLYIPPVVSGVATIGCITAITHVGIKRTAAMATAYTVTEQAFQDYREKVIEELGAKKEQKIRDEVVQDKILANPPNKEIVISGPGNVLCCELFTGRYFNSDMHTLQKAQNEVNALIVQQVYVTLDDFYDRVGLSHTSNSDMLGWDSDKLMELKISTVLTEDGRPCLAFDYNYTKRL